MSVSDTHIKIDLPPDTGVEELRLVRKAIQESVMEEHVSRYYSISPFIRTQCYFGTNALKQICHSV